MILAQTQTKPKNHPGELLTQAVNHLQRISRNLGAVENLSALSMYELQDALIRLHLSLECLETLRRNYTLAPRIIKQLTEASFK